MGHNILKKSLKIILSLLLLGIFASVHFVQVEAAYQVAAGQTFHYDAKKASIEFSVNGVSSSNTGYTVDGHQLDEGTQFTITFTIQEQRHTNPIG